MKKFTCVLGVIVVAFVIVGYATGHFGASSSSLQSATVPVSTVAIQSIKPITGTAALADASAKLISWNTTGGAESTVDINLIKKVTSAPASYVFVQKIAANIANTGSYTWSPSANETASDLYIEVTCSSSSTNCKVTSAPIPAN